MIVNLESRMISKHPLIRTKQEATCACHIHIFRASIETKFGESKWSIQGTKVQRKNSEAMRSTFDRVRSWGIYTERIFWSWNWEWERRLACFEVVVFNWKTRITGTTIFASEKSTARNQCPRDQRFVIGTRKLFGKTNADVANVGRGLCWWKHIVALLEWES